MKRKETPDILKKFRDMKLRKELTVLLAFFVMISTSYVMIHPGEALNNSTARSFMFFNEEEGTETENQGELINAGELLEKEREAEAVYTATPAAENNTDSQEVGSTVSESQTTQPADQNSYPPTSTPAESVTPVFDSTSVPVVSASTEPAVKGTSEPTGSPDSLMSASPDSDNSGEPSASPSAETERKEPTASPEILVSASPETTEGTETAELENSPSASPDFEESAEPSASPSPTAEVEYPPFFEENIIPMEENDVPTKEDIRVTVKAPEGVFPEGTKVEVKLIRDEKILKAIEDAAVEKAQKETEGDIAVRQVQAVDITFYDAEGTEIQPKNEQKVTVTFKSGMIKEAENTTVVHVEQDDKKDIIDATAVETVNDPKESTLVDKINADEVVIETPSFSVYGIVGTETIEKEITLTTPDGDVTYVVSVTYGEDAQIPDNASLEVAEIEKNSEKYNKAKEEIINAKKEKDEEFDEASFKMAALDITILDENGNPVEPAEGAEVKVSLKVKELPASEEVLFKTMEVQHINEKGGKTEVETVADVSQVKVANGEANTEFTIDSFSTFALTWTDGSSTIHWGYMNGTTFVPLDESTASALDTSVGTVSIETTISGYTYSTAFYTTSEVSNPSSAGTGIDSILYKTDSDTWQYAITTVDDTGTSTTNRYDIENGSHIYAIYHETTSTDPQQSDSTIKGPSTIKNVTANKNSSGVNDGTYDIQLDITGSVINEKIPAKANILVVFDKTYSMVSNYVGSGSSRKQRWDAAISALDLMMDTLDLSNDIEFAFVSFDNSADITSWGSNSTSHSNYWTTSATAFQSEYTDLNKPSSGTGTNWEDGLAKADTVLNQKRSGVNTYILFLTDGEPNRSNTHGERQSTDTYRSDAQSEATSVAGKGTLYAVYCGSESEEETTSWTPWGQITQLTGYGQMVKLVSDTGSSAAKTVAATNENDLKAAFKDFANAINNSFSSSGVSTNDGITSLSSVSASVVDGAAGAFRYYYSYLVTATTTDGVTTYTYTDDNGQKQTVAASDVKTYTYTDSDGETQSYLYYGKTEWDGAPGASYSDSTGVTWDLSSVGTLANGKIYSVVFTVWPSQDAYDLIADLNNELIKISDSSISDTERSELYVNVDGTTYTFTPGSGWTSNGTSFITSEALQSIIDNASSASYSMKTNTNLDTTYTYSNGNTYKDSIDYYQAAMDLKTETMKVQKIWNNTLDNRTANWIKDDDGNALDANGNITTDPDEYVYYVDLIVTKGTDEYDTVRVTSANDWISEDEYISCGQISSGVVKEEGHDYSLKENPGDSYYWDLTADVYHPMVIDGVATMLVKVDTEAESDYTIAGSYYKVQSGDEITITAKNDRRSRLNLKKQVTDSSVDQGADIDALFEYTITIGAEGDEDIWFSASTGADTEDDPLVYQEISTRSENVIPEGGTSSFYHVKAGEEFKISIKKDWNVRFINLPIGTEYSIVESNMPTGFSFTNATATAEGAGTAATITSAEKKASGDIDAANTDYSVVYNNSWNPSNTLTVTKNWSCGSFVTKHGDVQVALFKTVDNNLVYIDGTLKTISTSANASTASVTYNGISALDAVTVREVIVTTEDSETVVTPVDPSGVIAVAGENTALGSNVTDTYVVTYNSGTVTDSSRTDQITNTMPQLTVNKKDSSNKILPNAVFKLTESDGVTAVTGYESKISTNSETGNLFNGIYLPNGKYYLVETAAPDGFNKLTYKIEITVTNENGATIITAKRDDGTPIVVTSSNNIFTFDVQNSNGVVLPNTGGPGTLLYTLSGIALMLGAALMYGFRMRRRERRLN